MKCTEKHTKIQIPDEEWACPWCGTGADDQKNKTMGFVIEDCVVDDDCNLLHEQDEVYCHVCQKGLSGKALSAKYIKAKNLVTCPCCKGKGMIQKKK